MVQGDGEQVAWLDDFVSVVRDVHDDIIRESGGVFGEHAALLYSAVARPFQSAFGQPIYTTPVAQAAALFHALVCDHAFVDGNKRTATAMAMVLLAATRTYLRMDVAPAPLQVRLLGEVALETASSGLTVEQVAHWIERIFALPA